MSVAPICSAIIDYNQSAFAAVRSRHSMLPPLAVKNWAKKKAKLLWTAVLMCIVCALNPYYRLLIFVWIRIRLWFRVSPLVRRHFTETKQQKKLKPKWFYSNLPNKTHTFALPLTSADSMLDVFKTVQHVAFAAMLFRALEEKKARMPFCLISFDSDDFRCLSLSLLLLSIEFFECFQSTSNRFSIGSFL